ncbi:hypothetical protein D8B26_003371 [Coccidioides posadasii str. Silveira]|uniref:Uncharacterized protein n=1 Tax=Coccidioides posadasii (strain RMSCC 757 / Silveira) TaxID=443226 RepID=E9CZU3_COCPS|nr:hypothetical protein CPSG_03371 [Coccidioides posadasii str. Silveira]QVM08691.1 hypothetical protein D8B26_003371 [Coccidioides posadasii str. Silveira]
MFQRSVRDAALCLRCQNCLRPLWRPLTPISLAPSPNRQFQTTACSNEENADSETTKSQGPKFSTRRKGRGYHIEQLDSITLGNPSHVLVVDQKAKRTKQVTEKKDENPRLNRPSEVLEEVDRERYRVVGATEVSANFEYLRSLHKPGDHLFPVNWDKLRDVLQHGFTQPQLARYVKEYEANEEVKTKSKPNGDIVPSDRPRTWKWKVGTPHEAQEGLSPKLKKTRYVQGKAYLAEKIMRDCWGLLIRNEIGHADLHVQSDCLSTFLLSNSVPLRTVAEAHNVKIDVTKAFNRIRIIGPESDALQAYNAVEQLVARIRSKEVDLPKHGSLFPGEENAEFEEAFIQALQEEHGLFCRINKDSKKFVCYYLDENKLDAEKVCKSISLATSLPLDQANRPFTYFPSDQPANVYSMINPEYMSFPDRNKNWFRWAKPLLENSIQGGRAARRPPADIYSKEPTAPQSRISDSLLEHHPVQSSIEPFTHETVTAAVGKCLFQREPKFKADEITFSEIESSLPKRTFIADVPNTWSFLKTLSPVDTDAAIHRIRLLPSPSNDVNFPVLELEMEVPQTKEWRGFVATAVFRKATAILRENHADMLLPETALDIRFTRTVHYDLLEGSQLASVISDKHPSHSSLLQCVASLNYLLPISRHQPPMPLFCKVSLPKKLLAMSESSSGQKGETEGGAEGSARDTEFIEGEYVFPPLRSLTAARIARFNYKDLELSFSNPRTGPLFPIQNINMSLSVGRSDDELRPLIASRENRGSAPPAMGRESLRLLFPPLYTRACQLAFELSAHRENNTDDSE